MKTIWCFGIIVSLSSVESIYSQGLDVDQSWLGSENLSVSSIHPMNDPIGQEFTPSFSALNAIEFVTGDVIAFDREGATLQVKIRNSDMNGQVIAESIPQDLPDGYSGTTKFEFPSLVPVVPGQRYFFQIQMLTTPKFGNWAVASDFHLGTEYPGGNAVWAGMSGNQGTLIFREGIILNRDLWLAEPLIIPEPSTLIIAGVQRWFSL